MRNVVHGTPEQFEDAVRMQINKLERSSETIESSQGIEEAVLAKGKTWQEFISNLETENDVEVDSAYKDKYNNFIEFYTDGELFEGEVTKYHGGDYELLQENVRKVQASKVMSTVQGEIDKYFDDDEYKSNFTYIDSKEVTDSDGFITEYTWYKSEDGNNVFVFGDPDMYRPEDGNFDYETENDELAQEWFSSYTGFDDYED